MTQELEKKAKAWGNFGVRLYEAESELSAKLAAATSELSLTIDKENVEKCELALTSVKSQLKQLQESRKELTNKLDDVKARLMIPEKDLQTALKEFEGGIISVKKEIQLEYQKANAKGEEEKDLASKIKLSWVNYLSAVEKAVKEAAYNTYSNMLDKSVEYKDYDTTVKKALGFDIPQYKPFFQELGYTQRLLSDAEKGVIYTENKGELFDTKALFLSIMNEKKAGYKSELANIDQAKLLMIKAKSDEDKAAKAKLEAAQLELKLSESTALDAEKLVAGKQLKEVFEVDMPEDYQSALKLYAAFSANLDILLPILNTKKWLSLTPESIGKALSKLKSKDNSLNFEGINFKNVSKL